jgi:chromosome segregation ATPase
VKPQRISRPDADQESSQAARAELEQAIADCDEARDNASDLADELRLANAELDAYRAGEVGEGEKRLVAANKRVLQLEGEVRRLEDRRNALMNENSELKREVKNLRKRLGVKANG